MALNARRIVVGAAVAVAARLAGRRPAAFAWVHRSDELNARRVGDAMVGARDDRLSSLERLAQGIEHIRLELQYYGANSPNMVIVGSKL